MGQKMSLSLCIPKLKDREPWGRMIGWLMPWSLLISLHLCSWQLAGSQVVRKVLSVYPNHGGQNGATRLTIKGQGFSVGHQFDFGAEDEKLGNSVQLVSDTRSIPCDVERESSHETQIICYTRPLPYDTYVVVVSVDGVPIVNRWIKFYARNYRTPTIEEISPMSGLPGQLITIRGKIFTDVYGSNKPMDSSHSNTKIVRVYAGGKLCDLLHPDSDNLYGLKLNSGNKGTMTCRMTGTYIGHHNMSFILDNGYGRSLPTAKAYFVSSLNKLSMFQTYAEMTGIYPSEGSMEGGTQLTVKGRFFDETDAPARVTVAAWSPSVTRLSGFFVAPVTDDYRFYIRGSGVYELFLSLTGHPQDKVKIAYGSRKTWSYTWFSSQASDILQLEESKEYYMEVLLQETTSSSFVSVAVYRNTTSYTEQQTADSINEQQYIRSLSQVVYEKQVVTLENWTIGRAVSEVQLVTITSPCWDSDSCSFHWFRLIYNQELTGLLPADASGEQIEQALNDLWSIKPDTVKVSSTAISQGFAHTVTFISTRGDFDLLQHEALVGSKITIEVVEQVKGRPSMDTFTLRLDGINSRPLPSAATADEVKAALEGLVGVKCPEHIAGYSRGYAVKYFDDFEDGGYSYHSGQVTVETDAFCGRHSVKNPYYLFDFAQSHRPVLLNTYKQSIPDHMSTKDTGSPQETAVYNRCRRGSTLSEMLFFRCVIELKPCPTPMALISEQQLLPSWIPSQYYASAKWSYTCINLLTSVQAMFPKGSNFLLRTIHLGRESGQDFFVDTVYIGQHATTSSQEDSPMRTLPPLIAGGIIIQKFIVTENRNMNDGSSTEYEITMVPFNCSFNFPLLEIGFAQIAFNSSKDRAAYRGSTWPSESIIRVWRREAASPPITGTMDIQAYGQLLKGLPVNISTLEMQYSLQSIPEVGTVAVQGGGSCSSYDWIVTWLNKVGNQRLLQVNDSNVHGVDARITVTENKRGGQFSQRLIGDLFRTPHALPQVQVFINSIPSKCSGDCGYRWTSAKTPVITGISPSRGSSVSGTVLTISGFRFTNSSKTDTTRILVGGAKCPITGLTDTEMTCLIGPPNITVAPVTVYIAALGLAKHSGNQTFTFTYELEVAGISPSTGSAEGGTVLTISGSGFPPGATVLVGKKPCRLLTLSPSEVTCSTPAAAAGVANISVFTNETHSTLPFNFTYTEVKMPAILKVTPTASSVAGGSSLTIHGSNFGNRSGASRVFIGNSECPILQWWTNNITCRLPSLPPGVYTVQTHAPDSSVTNVSIKYILRVTGMTPWLGSLYGGTAITISGAGFSATPEENTVQLGSIQCPVTFASPNVIECVLGPTGRTFIITNNGSHPTLGVGYSWNPSALNILVGDTIHWRWEAPPLIQGLSYRVFSVSKSSDVDYKGRGFISGNTGTPSGFFSHRFTSPGSFFYSSGYIDQNKKIFLQGTVHVRAAEENSLNLRVSVAASEAEYLSGHLETAQSQQDHGGDCTAAKPTCPQSGNSTSDSDGFTFLLSPCYSPTINSFTPSNGTIYDKLTIVGTGFSNVTCANEVRVGQHRCIIEHSTEWEILCHVDVEEGMEVGVAALVSVNVHNHGSAISTPSDEFSRHFVLLPHLDRVTPSLGSTTGRTRVTLTGSGFGKSPSTIQVQLASVPCTVVSVNYTHISCDSSASVVSSGIVSIWVRGLLATCTGSCNFTYTESITPSVLTVSSDVLDTVYTDVTISGRGFGSQVEMVLILVGTASYRPTDVSDTSLNTTVGPLPVGQHPLRVLILDKGLSAETLWLTSAATASLLPASGGINGGTTLSITGNGFVRGATTVTVDGSTCRILTSTPGEVKCVSPACGPGIVQVKVTVHSTVYPLLTFTCNQTETPAILAASPTTGVSGTRLTILGQSLGSVVSEVMVSIDGVLCSVTMANESCVECTVGHHAGGNFPILLEHVRRGYANSGFSFQYQLNITSVSPAEGSFGGGLILMVKGTGFDIQKSRVFVCDSECRVEPATSSSSSLHCHLPLNNGTGSQQQCSMTVVNSENSIQLLNAFTYTSALTPVVTAVEPRRGGTAGGTKLTITGSGFSSNINETSVTVAEAACEIQSVNETNIVCITGAQSPSQKTKVKVNVKGNGIAKLDFADYYYVDVWSSRYTWGGQPPPEKGSLVVITKGQTILLDQSTPVLKMLLIQGGSLIFDEVDIEFQAENILITDGGLLQVGTSSTPFQHKATITLHGHLRSRELPLYGSKTLAVREGTLELHGQPVPVTWTHLSETAEAGTSTITLQKPVSWQAGDQIVIATTGNRHSQGESEQRTVGNVSMDGRTLYLTEGLRYRHLGTVLPLPGTVLEARAEVGLLTRNVVVRGSNNVEWNDRIERCPDGFDTGEFTTQTCFQGRLGEEIGSDEYGGCIMFHSPHPDQGLVQGRIEYVEVYHAGQAFRVGRYPVHWHLLGDLSFGSYMRGCSIHQTFNRAVTIHGTHQLLVEDTVAFNVKGGAFFLDDGVEQDNVLRHNLAVRVRQSTSLLNDDLTPAAFWVTHPSNTLQGNTAVGGTHFGFWYRLLEHPDGASWDQNLCPRSLPLGLFLNNSVHSQGWYGLWIFPAYHPNREGRCSGGNSQPAAFYSLTVWNCRKGAEWTEAGALQFHDFLLVNNEEVGVDIRRVLRAHVGGWGLAAGALLSNLTVVGHARGLDPRLCTRTGLLLPLDEGLTVDGLRLVNFDQPGCAALGLASITGSCRKGCGGWSVRFNRVHYSNVSNKAAFHLEHEIVLHDTDGSLAGGAGYKVVPYSRLLDPARCQQSEEWSQQFPGVVCDSTVSFHHVSIHSPSPSALWGRQLILSNAYGSSSLSFWHERLNHGPGWMALIPNNQTVNWHFKDMDHITEISYRATFYHFMDSDHVVISHNLTQHPDHVQVTDLQRTASLQPLGWAHNQNGDWYFDAGNRTLYYLGKGAPHYPSLDPTMVDVNVHLRVFRCFYQNCSSPPQSTLPPFVSSASQYSLWSNNSFWESSPENNFTVPREGDSVVIAQGVWLLVDIKIPPLFKLTIYGTLEVQDENTTSDHNSSPYMSIVLNATYISVQGGRLIAGMPEKPFRGELLIVLRGDHLTPDWPLPDGPNQGAKVLGVFGGLDLHGIPHRLYRTKLGQTAPAGSLNLTLAAVVDWQEGDEILVTSTSYDSQQTESRRICSISHDRMSLLLDRPLSFAHVVDTQEMKGRDWRYSLAADVALLSRNIKIVGQDFLGWQRQKFGARVLISSFFYNDLEIKGYARIKDVEFYHSGQNGYWDYFDPRYSVAFLNLGQIQGNNSYIQGCAIHNGFAPAIGVFGTDGLNIDDNIIYNTLGEGIKVWGSRNRVRRNLVVLSKSTATLNSWTAAIEVNKDSEVVLRENIIVGFEQIGYHINGEPCPGQPNLAEPWANNEVRGGRIGVYMNGDGFPKCSLIQGFIVWKCQDFGIYFQVRSSVQVSNVTLVDNGLGIFPMIYGPPALSHQISNKTVHVTNALIVGVSPGFNCSDTLQNNSDSTDAGNKWMCSLPATGRSGICWPTFASASNFAPRHQHSVLVSYPAISGLMMVQNTTFVGFRGVCSKELNTMFISNPNNEDMQHPVLVEGITIDQSEERGKVFIHRPDVTKVNPNDCVDMDCDGKKKALLKDLDGSFLGGVGAVIPQSEYEWNGDKRRGLGDYRIPKVLLTYLNGSRIPVSQVAPQKGIIRDSTCTYIPDWQSYKCFGLNYELLVIESLDSDTERRRLSPVALLCDGYLDLINGPQDHGWCTGYTCHKRISLFFGIVATNKSCDIYFTSTSPQSLRLLMPIANASRALRLLIYYSLPQRLDVYINGTFVPPTNAEWNSAHTDYTLRAPTYPGEFVPKLKSPVHGANYFDRKYQMLNVLLRGSIPVEIHTAPTLFISFDLPSMTVDEFYGPDLANNLALFLDVPANKIRITKIVREDAWLRRRARSITVEVEIGDPPYGQLSSKNSTSTSAGTLKYSDLKEIASSLGDAMLTGNLNSSLGFEISGLGISGPFPTPDDPEWSQVATQPVQREKVSKNHVATVAGLVVVTEPIAGDPGQVLRQQPSLVAVDFDGKCVSVGVTSWELVAVLVNSQGMPVPGLNGTTRILFEGCWAKFTDLSISINGTNYRLRFQLRSLEAQSHEFSVGSEHKSPEDPDSDSSPSLDSRSGIIAGATLGGLLLISIAVAVTWKVTANRSKVASLSGKWAEQSRRIAAVARTAPTLPPVHS
ncbi:PKHD1 like 1, tandem duplicate 1 [Mobula birostris]|uniref:PKHD1 like 1, tandem duplicate 1 n=1 Tax=Mobula birostris TaxID=1983395 RepID=UPI003B28C05B